MAEVRKEERRGGEDDVKVGPTSLTVTGTEIRRERRDAGVGGLRREGLERDLLREEGRKRKESLVACGSARYCWERKESKPNIAAEEMAVLKNMRRRRKRAVVEMAERIFGTVGSADEVQ